YVTEGRSHLIDFAVNGVGVGTSGSEVALAGPAAVKVTARVAALLDEKPDPGAARRPPTDRPYWSLERARGGDGRRVPVEVVVHARPAQRAEIEADGTLRDVAFDVPIARSSWVALRILGSSHTNPVFVLVGGKPIRASRKSADWCERAVERCWKSKVGR